MTRCFFARLRSGFGGEAQRVVHIFEIPDADDDPPARLWAMCQAVFAPHEIELLGAVGGMPCESCLAVTPIDVEMI